VTVFNHPPPCAPILTLSHGPHPACAARVRNLNAAPGACSPHEMSRPVSMSACGLALEPSNGVHTTPTQVTHNHHHHHHHHHHHPPLAFTPPTHPDDRPRRAEHFIAKLSAVRLAGGGGASRRARAATPHPYRFEPQPPTLPLTHVKNHAHTSPPSHHRPQDRAYMVYMV